MNMTPGSLRCLFASLAPLLLTAASQNQTLYTFPDQGFTPVYNFINSATKTLDMTMYELVDTTAEKDLASLAAKGVTVHVILDHNLEAASNQPAYNYLTANGVAVHWANPKYHATHQKTITVDGRTSLILTANLTTNSTSPDRDFAITDTGAKDVAEIEAVFNADFNSTDVTPTSASSLIWSPNEASTALVSLMQSAKHSLLVESEEMSDPTIVATLANSAKAGVAVKVIMTNGNNAYASEFETLTQAGAKVYTYADNSTTLYIHAKVMLIDYGTSTGHAFLGSENFSTDSLTQNRELGQTTHNATVLSGLSSALTSDVKGGTLWTKTTASVPRQLK
jgi:cardiolipin synthase A/B